MNDTRDLRLKRTAENMSAAKTEKAPAVGFSGRMSKPLAEKIAKQLVKRRVSVFSLRRSLTVALKADKLLTDTAYELIRTTFLIAVINSKNYSPFDKMYAEDRLASMLGIRL